MDRILVTMAPERDRTRVLVMSGADEMMRAVLGPATQTHPRAAATLLEGLALWHQRRVSVVLCVGERSCGSELGLYDALEFGDRNVHYEVGVVVEPRRQRPRRLGGLGNFRSLRQLTLEEVAR
jgi:hypothetical protein